MALSRGSKVFVVVLLVLLAAVAGGLWYLDTTVFGDPGEGEAVVVEVESGSSVDEVGQELADQGVIGSILVFRMLARGRDLDSSLQAGSYEFRTGMSINEALDVLGEGAGERDAVRFTVEEGLPVEQTLTRLAEQFDTYAVDDFRAVLDDRVNADGNEDGVLQLPDWVPALSSFGGDVRAPFEGLLWPQTYEVAQDASTQAVLQTMIDRLAVEMEQIPSEQVEQAEQRGLSRYQVLSLASLVERETRVDDERGLVSGVIANRLEQERPLQIDATVLYARGEHAEQVLIEDTEVDSAYNTYQVTGLPPTPISGVGTASLRAAFSPDDVPFLFYVLAPECDGRHVFAETLEEHNRNVQAFRDAGRCLE